MQTTSKSGRKLYLPTQAEDRAIQQGIAEDPDTVELDAAFFALARPAAEVLGACVVQELEARRDTKNAARAETLCAQTNVSLSLDQDVLDALLATGPGWDRRANDLLRADIVAGRLEHLG